MNESLVGIVEQKKTFQVPLEASRGVAASIFIKPQLRSNSNTILKIKATAAKNIYVIRDFSQADFKLRYCRAL